jgi:hypothetical protein
MPRLITARHLAVAAVGIVALLAPARVGAQQAGAGSTPEPDLKKWDATGIIGWHRRPVDTGLYETRMNSLFAGATLGRYWTENVKTEVELGNGGTIQGIFYWDDSFRSAPYGRPAAATASDIQVSGAQIYQFFHNAWFHPFVGAGALYDRERLHASRPAQQATVYSYSNGKTITQEVSIPAWTKDSTGSKVSGFILTGFKAYVAAHAFFRGDFRLTFGTGSRAINTRIGFGFDF